MNKRIDGLPFVPGNTFLDPTLSDFRKSSTFRHKNGFFLPKDDYLGVGNCPIPAKQVTVKDLFEIYNYDPILTYGVPRARAPKPLIPAFVALEKKTLKFYGYYKETVNDSPIEPYRVRLVNIFYYLEDDSIMVDEPRIENSGLFQGRVIKRSRIPKNDKGEFWHWTDLNIGCDIMFYGRVFRFTDCDKWTKEFYETEGVIMNDPEDRPEDPYTSKRLQESKKQTGCYPNVMCLGQKKALEYGAKVLKFHTVWDDRHEEYGALRKFDLVYHLADDMVEVVEPHAENSGRDPVKMLLHKMRLPKHYEDLRMTYPIASMEPSPSRKAWVEYYEPVDFKIGETINVFGRRFLIYDMDKCTKAWYRDFFGYTDFTPICVEPPKKKKGPPQYPPWNGWGAPEDSLQSCLAIVPKKPKYDAMKRLVFELKVLKFGATMDSTRPEDQGREFTVSYRLVDDKMSVYERPVRNSGWPGGKFLDYCRVMKPGTSKDNPEYYGPHDLYVGAVVDVFNTRFCLNSADRFVLDFIRMNPDCFPCHVKENIEKYFECEEKVNPKEKVEQVCDPGSQVCEEPLGEGFFEHLGLGIQRKDVHPCRDNPNPVATPYDWNVCRQMGWNCGRVEGDDQGTPCQPPAGEDGDPSPGNPDMFEQLEHLNQQPCEYVWPDQGPPNPKLVEEMVPIPPEKYDYYKDHRFDCYNPKDMKAWAEKNCQGVAEGCKCPVPCPVEIGCQGCYGK